MSERKDRAGCEGCRYCMPIYIGDGDELLSCCVYILRTGRKRPCKPGAECTVFEGAAMDENSSYRRINVW